jgi:hypothetical protein
MMTDFFTRVECSALVAGKLPRSSNAADYLGQQCLVDVGVPGADQARMAEKRVFTSQPSADAADVQLIRHFA